MLNGEADNPETCLEAEFCAHEMEGKDLKQKQLTAQIKYSVFVLK